MKASDIVKKARAGLILDSPFFGSIALRMDLIEDDTCKTFYTNGKVIGYNPQYVDTLTLNQVKGIIAHEVMHVANGHHLRQGQKEHDKWNIATDYAINPLLVSSGFELPKEVCFPSQDGLPDEKSAEFYYSNARQASKDDSQAGQGQGQASQSSQDTQGQKQDDKGNIGEVRPLPGKDGKEASETEINQASAEMKQTVSQATQSAKAFGKMTEGLQRMVSEILTPIVDWKEVLRRFVGERARNDYSWTKPNKRYLASGVILPSLYSEEMKELVVVVDTSGSIDDVLLSQFASECDSIKREYHTKLTVMYVDSKLQGVEIFEQDDDVVLHPQGGGGTSFKPAFEEVEKRDIQPACLVYLTDGQCYRFPSIEPSYSVLWVLTEKDFSFKPYFGEIAYMV